MARQSLRVRGVLRRRAAYAQEDARIAARLARRATLILIGMALVWTIAGILLGAQVITIVAVLGIFILGSTPLWIRYLVLRARAHAAALRWHRGDTLNSP